MRVLCTLPLLVSGTHLQSLIENCAVTQRAATDILTRSKAAAPSLEKRTLDAMPPCGLTMTVADD